MNDHLIDESIVKQTLDFPDPDSHKGNNGKILIVGGSVLFHGAGILAAQATYETLVAIASKTNDMVYFCSTAENLEYLKQRQETFIGITREQLNNYLPTVDVVLVGPGLMREPDVNRPETNLEPEETKTLTQKILDSNKRSVLDAGSLQVIDPRDLKGKRNVIITPHRFEMARLFAIDPKKLEISHSSNFETIEKLGLLVKGYAKDLGITILLKGPIDIIADSEDWAYSSGGNAGMTKGGSGDVLAGIIAALYSKAKSAFLAASLGSFLAKKTGDELNEKKLWFYNSSDLVNKITDILAKEFKKQNDASETKN